MGLFLSGLGVLIVFWSQKFQFDAGLADSSIAFRVLDEAFSALVTLNSNFVDSLIASRVSDDAFLSCYRLIRFCVSSSCLHNVLRNFTRRQPLYNGSSV